MLSYVVAPWFQPAVYYSLKFNDVDMREGLENKQHDLSLTLRFDINCPPDAATASVFRRRSITKVSARSSKVSFSPAIPASSRV